MPLIAVLGAGALVLSGCSAGEAPTTGTVAVGSTAPSASVPVATARPRATLPPAPTPLSEALKVQRTGPEGLLSADGSLWVAQASGSVVRLDPATGKVQASITGLGDGLLDPFDGDGRIWVPSARALFAIDPATNKVVLTVKGTYSMTGAATAGHVWIGDGHDRLLELDASSGRTVKTLSIGGPGENVGETCSNAVASGAGAIWWSVNDAGVIVRVDPSTAQTTGKAMNVGTSFVTVADGTPWAVSNGGNVLALDPTAATVATSVNFLFSLPDVCAGPIVADGSTLWFYDGRSSCGCGSGSSPLYRFDASVKGMSGSYDPGDIGDQSIAVVNHSVWLDFSPSGVVARYDPPFP